MKIKLYILLLTLCVLASSYAETQSLDTLHFSTDELLVSFPMTAFQEEVKPDYALTLTPILITPGVDTLRLKSVVFRAKRNVKYVERGRYFGDIEEATTEEVALTDTCLYEVHINRAEQEWLWSGKQVQLVMERELTGCCETCYLPAALLTENYYGKPRNVVEEPQYAQTEEQLQDSIYKEQPQYAQKEEQPQDSIYKEQPQYAQKEEQPQDSIYYKEQPQYAQTEEQPQDSIYKEQPQYAQTEEQPQDSIYKEQPQLAVNEPVEEQPTEEQPVQEQPQIAQTEPEPVVVPVVPVKSRAEELSQTYPTVVHIKEYEAYTDTMVLRKRLGALIVYFPFDKSSLNRDFRNNATTMDTIIWLTEQIKQDTVARIRKIQIIGLASVEGHPVYNKDLSMRRALALKRAVQTEVYLPDSVFECTDGGEAWAELRSQIEELDIDGRDEMLQIIDNEADVDVREQRLRELKDGKPYEYLRRNVLADERNAGYVRIYYDDEKASQATPASRGDELSEESSMVLPMSQYEAYSDTVALRTQPKMLYVYFPFDKSVVRKDFRDNAYTLQTIIDVTKAIMADSASQVTKIQIIGLASIEGHPVYNKELSLRRAIALKRAVMKEVAIPEELFECVGGGEAWAELRSQIEELDIEGRDEMLQIIDTEKDLDVREQKLRELMDGKPYEYLKHNILADQRNSGYVKIYYENK